MKKLVPWAKKERSVVCSAVSGRKANFKPTVGSDIAGRKRIDAMQAWIRDKFTRSTSSNPKKGPATSESPFRKLDWSRGSALTADSVCFGGGMSVIHLKRGCSQVDDDSVTVMTEETAEFLDTQRSCAAESESSERRHIAIQQVMNNVERIRKLVDASRRDAIHLFGGGNLNVEREHEFGVPRQPRQLS